MLDYMIWPWMERLPCISDLTKGMLKVRWDEFPKLVRQVYLSTLKYKQSYLLVPNITGRVVRDDERR